MKKSEPVSINHHVPKELRDGIIQEILLSCIRNGNVDPVGKSDAQILEDFIKFLSKQLVSNGGGGLQFVVDHRDSLLSQAKQFRKARHSDYAILFYATWVEHWINGLITVLSTRKKIGSDVSHSVIREAGVRSKMTWVLSLMQVRAISLQHLNVVISLCERRNNFVHYKWKPLMDELDEALMNKDKVLLEKVEKSIRYLKSFEKQVLGTTSRRHALKVIRKQGS